MLPLRRVPPEKDRRDAFYLPHEQLRLGGAAWLFGRQPFLPYRAAAHPTGAVVRSSGRLYHAAGDHLTRIAGRLRCEIVRLRMDDNRSADDLAHMESAREKDVPGVTSAGEQRRQISGVERMRASTRIVVAARVCERFFVRSSAASSGVNMQRKYGICALRNPTLRQTADRRRDQHTGLRLPKFNQPVHARICRRTLYDSDRVGLLCCQLPRKICRNTSIHNNPPEPSYALGASHGTRKEVDLRSRPRRRQAHNP